MTPEEKQLFFGDLCARLPYGVKYNYGGNEGCDYTMVRISQAAVDGAFPIEDIKPYLRPMSSMTQEEIDEYDAELDKDMEIVINGSLDKDRHITSDGKHTFSKNFVAHFANDWLNKKGFDYRGLIPMGLALEAPEGMYNN